MDSNENDTEEMLRVSCNECTINESFAGELGVISVTLLTFTKKQLHLFWSCKIIVFTRLVMEGKEA